MAIGHGVLGAVRLPFRHARVSLRSWVCVHAPGRTRTGSLLLRGQAPYPNRATGARLHYGYNGSLTKGLRPMDTRTKGLIGELAVSKHLTEAGAIVFVPLNTLQRFDLLAYHDGRYYRIQVKYISVRNGAISVANTTSPGSLGKKKPYVRGDYDVMAIYCPDTARCYFLPNLRAQITSVLRVMDTKNGQARGIKWARDYECFPPRALSC